MNSDQLSTRPTTVTLDGGSLVPFVVGQAPGESAVYAPDRSFDSVASRWNEVCGSCLGGTPAEDDAPALHTHTRVVVDDYGNEVSVPDRRLLVDDYGSTVQLGV